MSGNPHRSSGCRGPGRGEPARARDDANPLRSWGGSSTRSAASGSGSSTRSATAISHRPGGECQEVGCSTTPSSTWGTRSVSRAASTMSVSRPGGANQGRGRTATSTSSFGAGSDSIPASSIPFAELGGEDQEEPNGKSGFSKARRRTRITLWTYNGSAWGSSKEKIERHNFGKL